MTQRQGSDTITSSTENGYADGEWNYALGAVVTTSVASTRSGTGQPTSTTTSTYDWYDGAVLRQVAYAVSGQSTRYTYYTNSASGVFQQASVQDGRPRTITVTSDALGQAVRRDEQDGNAWNEATFTGGDPHEVWYRFNGRQVGYTGNDGTWDTSYAASLDDRTTTVSNGNGAFRYGRSLGARPPTSASG
ncbi:MAG: hypothetical protein J0I47_14280 [Sphingomonas sp.]|uniref:hypothetical protein n=1 Tax=Sphingomonas sp. TaxID=28214 RepID=UPI001AC28A23|nr:hypothetical protein [Sphingomonas sp.]MBN8809385.1 hypothetical protein [Sphingomonas sp.]